MERETVRLYTAPAKITIDDDKTILSTADLLWSVKVSAGNVDIQNSTVTNQGSILIAANLNNVGSSGWTNAANSTLNIFGAIDANLTFTASASGNTVNYNVGDKDVIEPVGGDYYNLNVSSSGTKILQGDITVSGDLVISTTFDGNGNLIDLKGDWNNTSTFSANGGEVEFSGTADQSLTSSSETFFDLTINKASGTLNIFSDASITKTFTMTQGNINMGTNTLTLGFGTSDTGTLTRTSGVIIGNFERWINSSISPLGVVFPVGTATMDFTATLSSSSIIQGRLTVAFNESFPGNMGSTWMEAATTFYNTFGDGYWELVTGGFSSTNYTFGFENCRSDGIFN